jgi:hypothetical protein
MDEQQAVSAFQSVSLIAVLLKSVAFFVGLACIWMGYRLFAKGVFEGGAGIKLDGEAADGVTGGQIKTVLSMERGGPGLAFALFGMVIVAIAMLRPIPVKIEVNPAPHSPAGNATQEAPELKSQTQNIPKDSAGRYVLSARMAPGGPPEKYVYKNASGTFVIGPGSEVGTATYTWNEQQQRDKLVYIERASVNIADQPDSVDGWVYEASDDSGNKWWLFLSDTQCHESNSYLILYSFSVPSESKFKLWPGKLKTTRS